MSRAWSPGPPTSPSRQAGAGEPDAASADVAAATASAVAAAQLHMVYGRLRLTVLLTVGTCAVFFAPMVLFFPMTTLLAWLAVMLAVTAGRYLLWYAFRRTAPADNALARWDRLYVGFNLLAGGAWACGPVMMGSLDRGQALLLVGTLLAVSSVAAITQAARFSALLAFLTAALLPTVAVLLASADEVQNAAALVVLAAYLAMTAVGRVSNATIRTSIEREFELSRAVEQRERARAEAQAASGAKSRFLANMSHELRTPLNAVIGAAQLLALEHGDAGSRALLVEAIQKSGTNLLGLIEDILDLSRIEAGQLSLVHGEFVLHDCVESALATAALVAQAKGLALACDIDPALPARRHGEATRLRQVLLNLLGNAVKFTPAGEVRLRVGPGEAADRVRFSISDTGVGIGEASLPHIFEPFRQADDGADRRFGGSGLGLSIVHQLVQAMGGRISVRSQLGQGTCFEFELPLPRATPAADRVPTPVPTPAPTLAPRAATGHRGVQVLVVEDDPLNQIIVCRLLQHAGCITTAAADGAQALAQLSARPFDLVLMDWQMPDMDGLEVTRRIRAGQAGGAAQGMPIVALTANAFAEDRTACLEAGMNDFLTKPVLADRLLAVVQRWAGVPLPAMAASSEAAARASRQVDLPVYDPDVLDALPMVADGSDPGYVGELLAVFVDGARRGVEAIDACAAAGDGAGLQRQLHTLRSSAAQVGAMALAAEVGAMEAAVRAGASIDALAPARARLALAAFESALAERRRSDQPNLMKSLL
ncbi:ATP-binding protein [Ideonella sp. A 288]|uniref:ATP-binding protein n=1 Tax=Ideonella sp. A 288 TaxID=1962181 RepID=UPI000B4A6825|nr:ATP-binding protein [Ideonella sp. A 288]